MLVALLYLILAVLIITTLFVVVRTLVFQRRQGAVKAIEGVPVDDQQVAEHLAAAVRCRTVPLDDKGTPDPEAFAAASPDARRDLPAGAQQAEARGHQRLQPALHLAGQPARPGAGHADGAPGCRVRRPPAEWTHPPFEGVIVDGLIWGRGTLDIKNQLIGIMDAAETLLGQGYRPERTILFGLGHDEETGGVNGCKIMGQMLKERGVRLAGIVDEGGGITEGLAAGVRGAIGLIGVSEKGYLTVEITVRGQPGHSSTPPPQTAIGILARALARLEAHPMPTHLRRLRPLYRGIGKAAPIWLQVAFANIWLCRPFLRRWLTAIPEMNASLRTTTALTIIQVGVEDNTIPAQAGATLLSTSPPARPSPRRWERHR